MDFDILIEQGNVGFFKSAEITEIFLIEKNTTNIYNFFTIIVLEEKDFTSANQKFLSDRPISIDNKFSLGLIQYNIDIEEVRKKHEKLKKYNQWENNSKVCSIPNLKSLPKQFIPTNDGKRLNSILKNNFHSGSYILEFFDEKKVNLEFLLEIKSLTKFNDLCAKISNVIPIDLSVVRDRIGNFIFQFPITVVDIDSKALPTWDGIKAFFSWHSQLEGIPECLIQLEAKFDENMMGAIIENYNNLDSQIINIGNLDQKIDFKLWRKSPSLILYYFSGNFLRYFNLNMGIVSPNTRLFTIDGVEHEVEVSSVQRNTSSDEKGITYDKYISNNLYNIEKKQLEESLSFKQYKGVNNAVALNDIRRLIGQHDENGVYLWDPYLRANDILKTLYYSKTAGIELRAIASTNGNTANVYGQNGQPASEIINNEKLIFNNPIHDNQGLKLEFRMQHSSYGWKFHDRFLIFPGNELNKPKVYALGTSINSFGNEHNILQEVSHPQPVVDAFNELWNQLNNPECLVWKFPNI